MSTLFVNAGMLDRIADWVQPAPSITQWQRLESDPAELDLVAGLEARLADPLWLIGRQWQFAELKAEDAGMPVVALLDGEEGRLTIEGSGSDPDALPEVLIEAEPARSVLASRLVEASLDLREALVEVSAGKAFESFRTAFPLTLAPKADDAAGIDLVALFGKDALDASALAAALEAERNSAGGLARLPPAINVPAALREAALGAAEAWLEDWLSLLAEPAGASRWNPQRLEYSASISAVTADGAIPLAVPEYANGRFDWWAMEVAGPPSGSGSAEPVPAVRIPIAIRFPGMAADRLFEVESESVNLLSVNTGTTGLLAMLMIEYAVAASNDWYQMPLTLPYGTAFRIRELKVRDSFGTETVIGPAAAGSAHWSMFEVTGSRFADPALPLFVLPAATAHVIEGPPIEEVALFRDEIANLAWAVERQLPGLTPVPIRPQDKPGELELADPGAPDAALIYRLQTPVPANWFPLAPEPQAGGVDGAVVLRLRPLRRFGESSGSIDGPQGAVLQAPDGGELTIEEREIPRSGLVVTRSFQFARDAAGRRHVWLGRRTKVGRGEGSSGLQFDLVTGPRANG